MIKLYDLIGEFFDGSTEYYGEFETEQEAIETAERISKMHDDLGQFTIKTVLKTTIVEHKYYRLVD